MTKFCEVEPGFDIATATVLDPSAGGCAVKEMAYPTALRALGCTQITTLDVRIDSRATHKVSYLKWFPEHEFDLVITNPPYNLIPGFIEAALEDCKPGSFVVMLLRLNYFGAVLRREFWQTNMPQYCIVHSSRPRFLKGTQDSSEYAHFVWRKDYPAEYTRTYVV